MISATQSATTGFAAASASTTFTVAKAQQTPLSVATLIGYPGTPMTLSSTGGSVAGSTAYALDASSTGCTLNGDELTRNATGICEITASKAGDANYLDVSVTATISFVAVLHGDVSEGQTLELTAPDGMVFSSVEFASYGTPTGTGGNYVQGNCHASNSVTIVSNSALGQTVVSLAASNGIFGDPCGGTVKRLAVSLGLSLITPYVPITATGGQLEDVTVDGVTYRTHTFSTLGTDTFTVTDPGTSGEIEYLVVGGGGGGGASAGSPSTGGAGGGAGGLLSGVTAVGAATHSVVVGGGGSGGPTSGTRQGADGVASSFGALVASGGGGGGAGTHTAPAVPAGRSGGSGGGAGWNGSSSSVGGAATAGQGHPGADRDGNHQLGSTGGGGAGGPGAVGATSLVYSGGAGGDGRSISIMGSPIAYAGGGGAGGYSSGPPGSGGSGGGGSGGPLSGDGTGVAGVNQRGGGGGGASRTSTGGHPGGDGGSGIVIIRYRLSPPA